MLDSARADALRRDELADGYVRPDYGGYCFAGIPAAAASVVGADLGDGLPSDVFDGVDTTADHVVVVFLDSLGFEQFERVADDAPLLESFAEHGRVTPLTSTYPSETAACVTTMHTGREPVEHGMLGWNAHDPDADTVYETLPYVAKDGGDLSLTPRDLFDGDTTYERLASAGVDSHVVEPDYGPGYSDASTAGATTHHYAGASGFAVGVRDALRAADAPSYTYAYYPGIDTASHHHGPASAEYDATVREVCAALETAFGTLDDETAENTVVCLVADHGQVPVDGGTELEETGVLAHVRTDRSGTPLALGGPRNVHLRVTDEAAARACLDGLDALVFSREEALAEGLWGRGDPGTAFDRNCGDLVVVPREGALWTAAEAEELALAGMHGGLHPDEMLVPFGAAGLSDLR